MPENQFPEITQNYSRYCRQFQWQSKEYEAQLVRVDIEFKPESTEPVFPLVYRVPEANQCVTFYAHSFDSKNQGIDSKLASYFLMGEAKEPLEDNLRTLVGRYVILIIAPQMKNGRLIPVIAGFKFSTRQLFAWSGDSNFDNHSETGRIK